MAKLVRVELVGKGERDDPYRANLPTYQHIFHNVEDGFVYVNVPDEDWPFEADTHTPDQHVETSYGPALKSLSEEDHETWHNHLDSRYRERTGEFRPKVR